MPFCATSKFSIFPTLHLRITRMGKQCWRVADGRVIRAKDALPDNIPGHGDAFHPGVPITLETVAGNTITLDLGGGQFAYYMHLQPGSLRVKVGDRVRRAGRYWHSSAIPEMLASHICTLKSPLRRSRWLVKACPISSTDTVAVTRVTGPRNSTPHR
jgi:hypothetical protein